MEASKIFVPTNFYCPITGDLMEDPVTDEEGNSYERDQIMKWIQINKNSPITRNYLDETHLSQNLALKRSIEAIKDQLQADQMRIDSQITDLELKPFQDCLSQIQLNSYYLDDKLFVNIKMPDIDVRPPIDIVLCIDVSYSMFDEATLKGDQNETISHGFSVLSLTVTAAKTILHSLNDNDNLSIVTYSSEAVTLVENIACTSENKVIIEAELDNLKPISNTNMWAGIHQSLDILRKTSQPNKLKGILLLTDGIPNVEPPRGHSYMLEKYFRDHNFSCMISCYGFGYNLQSELLMDLSRVSGGDGYSFIPDASILGTAFIHGISNLFTTAVYRPILQIQLSKNVQLKDTRKSFQIHLDSLKYGQDKNLIFDLNTSYASSRSLDYLNDFAKISLSFNGHTIETQENNQPTRDYYITNKYRQEAIYIINDCIQRKKYNDYSFRELLTRFVAEVEKEKINPYIQDLLFDLNGQIKEALNMTSQGEREDWFSRWGIHYLRSLQDAYQHELCNNFKDKGISNFGGSLFNSLRDQVSEIFDAQPPPKKDIPIRESTFRGGASKPTAKPRREILSTMSVYNNAGGGCCAEGSRVLMKDNSYKNVEDIRKGDSVVTFHTMKDDNNRFHESYSESKIECVIKTRCTNGQVQMIHLNNLLITPYHPIIDMVNYEKHWIYPISKGEPKNVLCPYMYTFVVENRQALIIERHIFATYGHNWVDQEVIRHNYFGTDKVIQDLKKSPSYNDGIVELIQEQFIRNEETNEIVSLSV